MRIIIGGGTGLIGRALSGALAESGHAVTVLSRSPERFRAPAPGARAGGGQSGVLSGAQGAVQAGAQGVVHAAGWDGRTADGWGALVDGADAVVNLAGAGIADGRWTAARKQLIHDSRTQAGAAITAAVAAARVKPKVLVQASAVGVYGPCGDERVTEAHAAGKDFLAGVCRDWEASTASVEAMGVRRAVIRTGVVLARDGGALPKMVLPFRFFAGGPVGSGRQYLPWIHLADEVAAICWLIEHDGAAGVYNLSAPEPVTNATFAKAIGRVLHRPSVMPAPAFALRLAFGEMATVLLDGQRAVPERLTRDGFKFRFGTPETALSDLLG